MLIDIHCHTSLDHGITRPAGTQYPTAEELLAMLDAAGIDRAVILSTVSPECRFVYATPHDILEIARRYPDRLIPFGNVDPRMLTNSTKSDFRQMLTYLRDAGAKGIGEYFPNIPFDDPLNLNVFRQIEEFGFPLTFHIAPAIGGCYGVFDELGLPRLERVLREFPRLIFLAHSQPFWAEISRDVTEEGRRGYPTGPVTPGRAVELMRRYPNLHGDLSARSGYNALTRDPEFGYAFLEEFQDRLYFGTDIANVPQDLPQVPYFRKLKVERLISPEAFEKITWRNAARLLGLPQETAR